MAAMDHVCYNLFNSFSKDNREFLCNICNHYLSVAPVLYNNMLGTICGRCEEATEVLEILKSKNSVMERQRIYESVAKYLIFPCSFNANGCDTKLKWDEVTTHEENCVFKRTVCLLSNRQFLYKDQESCAWAGEPTQLISHFAEEHGDYFTSNLKVTLGLESSSIFGILFGTDGILCEPKFRSKIYCINILNTTIIVVLYYHKKSNIYSCQMFTGLSYNKCNGLEYQLEVFDDNKKNSIVFPRYNIKSLRNYFTSKSNDEDGLEIDITYLMKLLNMPHFITADFRVLKNSVQCYLKPSSSMNFPLLDQMFDENILASSRCCSCTNYLLSFIHVCITGHNICGECRDQSNKINARNPQCPICDEDWFEYRNTALEKLMPLFKFPCKNKKSGCNFVASVVLVNEHEETCNPNDNQLGTCFLSECAWNGDNLKAHLKEKHIFSETNRFYKLKSDTYIFFFLDDVFSLELEYNLIECVFRYTVVCCETSALRYRYELQIVGGKSNGKFQSSLTLSEVCQPALASNNAEAINIDVPIFLLPQIFSNCLEMRFKLNIFSIYHL